MKQLLVRLALFNTLVLFSCSKAPNSPADRGDPGSADISISIGKVGALGKVRNIELSKLYITLAAPRETTIRDTVTLSGNSGGTYMRTYSNLASLLKTWTLTAESRDVDGAVIHYGSTQFIVPARATIPVNLTLSAKYSMLKANFFPVRDSVTRCELLVNGVKRDDSSFAKQALLGDTIRLSYNYLDTGVAQRIKLDVHGTMWGFDTLLYTGDTLVRPLSGANANYNITLKWVGPALPPPGQASMSVTLGPVGTVTVNGQMLREASLIASVSAPNSGVIAINPATSRLYIANSWSNVGVFDLLSNTFVASIPTAAYHNIWMVVNPVTNRLYVTQQFAGRVLVVDCSDNSVIADVAVPGLIHTIGCIGVNVKTNKIYISRANNGDVIVMDGVTHAFGPAVNLGGAPGGSPNMAIDTATNRIYCGVPDGRLAVINGNTQSLETFITLSGQPTSVGVNPVTRRIYATIGSSNTMSVIDGATNTVIGSVPTGPYPICPSVDLKENRIYVSNSGASSVSVFDGASDGLLVNYDLPVPQAGCIAINEDTGRFYVISQEKLYVFQE